MQASTFTAGRGVPAPMEAFAARNLQLLTAIESTLQALDSDTKIITAIEASYQEIRDSVAESEHVADANGNIENSLRKASDTCVRIYQDAQRRHGHACTDPDLRPDDGVADAYSVFIDAVRSLHDSVESLRDWIANHDAILQPTTGEIFATVGDLFESLMSPK